MSDLMMKRKFLFEADDDGTEATTTSGETTDTGDDTGTDDSTTTDDNAETSDDAEEENNDDDFSIDATPDDDGSGDDTGLDDTSSSDDSSSSDDMSSDTGEESKLDAAMFETLDDNEKRIKIAELKRLFIDLYSKSDVLVEKFNSIDEDDDEFNPIVKRIVKILYDSKEYVSYYLLNVFDSKSYLENMVVFKRHLSVLNGIKIIVKEIEKEQEKQTEN